MTFASLWHECGFLLWADTRKCQILFGQEWCILSKLLEAKVLPHREERGCRYTGRTGLLLTHRSSEPMGGAVKADFLPYARGRYRYFHCHVTADCPDGIVQSVQSWS